ncbi:MAG: FtsQ-type POTRA domain-containing protein [Longimicrobiales bacterium]|nr:FtsQ-type POTRA domain-containing protein [Longimicrobiales bacterium]
MIVRGLGIAGVAAVGIVISGHFPRLLVDLDLFRAREVQLEGLVRLERGRVLRTAGIDHTTNIWEDLEIFEDRLEAHPLVRSVRVTRAIPGRLIVEIEEREPVGLVPTPTLEPVDREGRYLPLDPARWQLDLPLLRPRSIPLDGETRPAPARLRTLAHLADAMRSEGVFWSRVSEIREEGGGVVVAEWGAPGVTFLFGDTTDLRRLRDGMRALGHAIERASDRGGEPPRVVDLRWADQVVVRDHTS